MEIDLSPATLPSHRGVVPCTWLAVILLLVGITTAVPRVRAQAAGPEGNPPPSNLIVIPVTINGDSAWASLVTSDVSQISPGVIGGGNGHRKPSENVQEDDVLTIPSPTVFLGNRKLDFRYEEMRCARMNILGEEWDGISLALGMDFLSGRIVEVDFDDNRVRFLKAVPRDPGFAIPIVSLRRSPRAAYLTVMMSIGDEPESEFTVALEKSDAVYLRPELFESLARRQMVHHVHPEYTVGSLTTGRVVAGTIDSIEIGEDRHQQVRVRVGTANAIGVDFLNRYKVVLDLKNAVMYLRNGRSHGRVDEHNLSGINAIWTKNGLQVRGTLADFPGDEAGLKAGDIIESVDRAPVTYDKIPDVRTVLRGEQKRVTLGVLRDGKSLELPLNLRATPSTYPDEGEAAAGITLPKLPELPTPPDLP